MRPLTSMFPQFGATLGAILPIHTKPKGSETTVLTARVLAANLGTIEVIITNQLK